MSKIRATECMDRTLMIRAGEADLFFYREHLIGLRTLDGTWAARVNMYEFPKRLVNTIIARQQTLGLKASWVRAVSLAELQEQAYIYWVKAFGEYARQRMTGEK